MTHPLLTRITSAFLVLTATFFLLFCGFGGYVQMFYWKFGAFAVLTCGYLLAMTVAACRLRIPLLPRRLGAARLAVIFYLGWTWLSAICSPHALQAIVGVSRFEGACTITLYGVVFLLVSTHARITAGTVAAFAASVTAECLLCLMQLCGLDPLLLYPEGMSFYNCGRTPRAFLGTVGNVDFLAAFFAAAIPCLLGCILYTRARHRFWLLLPTGLSLLVLSLMGTEGGLIGALFASVVTAVLCLPKKKRRPALCILLAGGLCLLALGYLWDGGGAWHALHALLHASPDPLLGSGRLYIWCTVAAAIPARLWLGYGPDTMLLHGFAPFVREDAVLGHLVAHIDTAHCEPLNVLYHQGLPALAAYLVLMGALCVCFFRARRTAAPLFAAVLGYFVQSLFGISVFLSAVWFWVMAGLLLAVTDTLPAKDPVL